LQVRCATNFFLNDVLRMEKEGVAARGARLASLIFGTTTESRTWMDSIWLHGPSPTVRCATDPFLKLKVRGIYGK
jgi:hypothetical protein